jgi:Uma2 family endonuclease
VVFVEVLSRSTRGSDLIRKADEYRQLESLRHYVVIEPLTVHVSVWSRTDEGAWPKPEEYKSLDGLVALPAIGVEVPVAEIYDGVPLEG